MIMMIINIKIIIILTFRRRATRVCGWQVDKCTLQLRNNSLPTSSSPSPSSQSSSSPSFLHHRHHRHLTTDALELPLLHLNCFGSRTIPALGVVTTRKIVNFVFYRAEDIYSSPLRHTFNQTNGSPASPKLCCHMIHISAFLHFCFLLQPPLSPAAVKDNKTLMQLHNFIVL